MAEEKQYREVGNKVYIYPDTGLEKLWMKGQIEFPANKEMYFNVTAYDTVKTVYSANAAHIHVYSYYLLCVQKQEYMPGIDPELAWSAESATATIGETNTFPTLTNEYELTVTYSSSSEAVATISSTGEITLVAAGTTTIKAAFAGSATYEADEATYTLTVESAELPLPNISWEKSVVNVYDNSDPGQSDTQQFYNPNNVEVTFETTNADVGGYDEEGLYTGSEGGSCTVSAIFEGNETYAPQTVTFTLSLFRNEDARLAWSVQSFDAYMEDENDFPTLINPYNVKVTYESDDTSIARIRSNVGTITLRGEGQTTIWANFDGDYNYASSSVYYSITVHEGSAPVQKPSPELAWSAASYTADYTQTLNYPTLTNPHNVDVAYSSSDTDIASIDYSTGVITLTGNGTCTISATHWEDNDYAFQAVDYSLTVINAPSLKSVNFLFSDDTKRGGGSEAKMYNITKSAVLDNSNHLIEPGDEIAAAAIAYSGAGYDIYVVDDATKTWTKLTTASDTVTIEGQTYNCYKATTPLTLESGDIIVVVFSDTTIYKITKNFNGAIYIEGANGINLSWYYDVEDKSNPGTYNCYMPAETSFGVESRNGESYTFNPNVTFVSGGSVGMYVNGGISADTEITKTN